MKKLLQFDKLDGDRKGVIKTIAEEGEIIATLKETFPAQEIPKPDTFPSLLFYYGMLTIKGTFGEAAYSWAFRTIMFASNTISTYWRCIKTSNP